MSSMSGHDLNSEFRTPEPSILSCHDELRAATREPHERLHLHCGFSAVNDGTITIQNYQALLIRLYGFYLPFERALGEESFRTSLLASDLAYVGINGNALSHIPLCVDLPRYDYEPSRLGALYVVEGSALGGRVLSRGLDVLLGTASVDGRRFFVGRGAGTGAAWLDFLNRVSSAGYETSGRAALVSAAVKTFTVFETWLNGWHETR